MPLSSSWEIWSVKCSLIPERSWQTSLTHSITQSTYNWPCGSLLLRVLKLWIFFFNSFLIYAAFSSHCVKKGFLGSSFYAYVKIKKEFWQWRLKRPAAFHVVFIHMHLHQRPLVFFLISLGISLATLRNRGLRGGAIWLKTRWIFHLKL